MAPYWQTKYWRRPFKRRRRRNWFYRRGIRQTLFRRNRRRRYRRKRFKVKRLKFKKRKLLKLKQWQPESIRKCKIVGVKCLFQGSSFRAYHNYTEYIYSTVPVKQPGGGGWALLVFSLSSLYEDYDHLKNIWTQTNDSLPLVRYTGCSFKFYQTQDTDYIVTYDTCWPMVATPHTHADSSPSRMILKRHKIVIPSRNTKQRRKPYKKVKIKPPSQMVNKWYFQQDICNTPLVMLTATAVSLTTPFANTKALSNNLTVLSLNTFIFQNPNFEHYPLTTGYSPKILQGKSMYLYATTTPKPTSITNDNFKKWLLTLTFLGNPRENKPGTPITNVNNYKNDSTSWGNPFFHRYLEAGDPEDYNSSYLIYISSCTILNIIEYLKNATHPSDVSLTNFQTIIGPIIYTLRYNPDRDTGLNKAYVLKTYGPITLDEPEDEDFILEGFPLYNLLWGWPDFLKKLKKINDLDRHTTLLIKSEHFNEKTLKIIWPIDETFIHGNDPFQHNLHEQYQTDNYNKQNWFPKIQFQDETLNNIATSGPSSPNTTNYLQSFCRYIFYFKFGGCPKQLPKALNPCLQSKWPTPDYQCGGITIQNPNRPPQTELYTWDWDKDFIKEQAISRIQTYTTTDEPLISLSATNFHPKTLQRQQKETAAKEEKNLFLQLHQLRTKRMHLELQCRMKIMELNAKDAK